MSLLPPSDAPPLEQWHPKVRQLYEYWQSIRPAPDRLPGRQHFDPLHIAALMPHVWMLDLIGEPMQYRYRLVGTRIAEAMQRDVTGQWYDDAHPGARDHPLYAFFEKRLRGGEATWRHGKPWLHVDPDIYEIEQVALPLARDGVTVDMALLITIFFRRSGEEVFR